MRLPLLLSVQSSRSRTETALFPWGINKCSPVPGLSYASHTVSPFVQRDSSQYTMSCGIELTDQNKNSNKGLSVLQSIKLEDSSLQGRNSVSYRSHVGWVGTIILVYTAAMAAVFIYLNSLYTRQFKQMDRPWAWVFILMSSFHILFFLQNVLFWRKKVKVFEKEHDSKLVGKSNIEESKRMTNVGKIEKVLALKNAFDLEGVYFLYKLYLGEFIGDALQTYNMMVLYMCTLPVGITTFLCLTISLKSFACLWAQYLPHTHSGRDRQLKLTILMNLICVCLPLSYNWIFWEIPLDIYELFLIILWPSISILSDLGDVLESIIRTRSHEHMLKYQEQVSTRISRRRASVFGKDTYSEIAKMQENALPKVLRYGLLTAKGFFGAFFAVVSVFQVVSILTLKFPCGSDRDSNLIWNDGCKVKVPFCKQLFRPGCDCSVLILENHNMTDFPPAFLAMKSLQKVRVINGPLRHLPLDTGRHLSKLADFIVKNNKLKTIPASLGATKRLTRLDASQNEIYKVPKEIWSHGSIIQLDLEGNNIKNVDGDISIENTYYLNLANNSISALPETINAPLLLYLYLNGNQLIRVPKAIFQLEYLYLLGLSRNNLTSSSFPSAEIKLQNLQVLDLRNNSMSQLPPWFSRFNKLQSLTLSNNPICTTQWLESDLCPANIKTLVHEPGQGCTPQCSEYCLDYLKDNHPVCLRECDSEKCDYSNGKC